MTREEAITVLKGLYNNPLFGDTHKAAFNIAIHDIKQRHDWDINNLILINKENYEPQTFKWCTDCKEYDQEKHCCHRWSKAIRNTVEEMKQEQEPRKGHWICDGKGRSFADYHCSECGLKLALCGQDIKQRQDSGYSLFCGGCGADMREVEK